MTLIYPGAVIQLPIKPHIRRNKILNFWICNSDHQTIHGPRRMSGVGPTARQAFLLWQDNVAYERQFGDLQ